ncbi:MAG: hypothetical protein AB1765_09250 [Candidatus Hydrogenedentota bacterium]
MSAVCALHYWVLGLLRFCVFALYTTYEKLKMICWLQAPGFRLRASGSSRL